MPRIKKLQDIVSAAKKTKEPQRLIVCAAHESAVLKSVRDAEKEGLICSILVGKKKKIQEIASRINMSLRKTQVLSESSDVAMADCAVDLLRDGQGGIIMKGLVETSLLLHAILDKPKAVAMSGGILSHVALFCPPGLHRIILFSDAGVNIKPDLGRKVEIVKNAIKVAHILGIEKPKVAMLAAVEKVRYPAMPSTTDAVIISRMSKEGQIKGAIVEGPFALDNAVLVESAVTKGIKGRVAGRADILCFPEIESANIFYKSLTCFAHLELASIVTGASVPIVVPSRADSKLTKLYSIALAVLVAEAERNKE